MNGVDGASNLPQGTASGGLSQAGSSRREFFAWLARGAAGAALVGLAAALAGGRRGLSGQECVSAGLCRGCPAYDGCGLPAALSARQAGMRPDTGAEAAR